MITAERPRLAERSPSTLQGQASTLAEVALPWRRLLVASVAILAATLVQAWGRIVADTKLGLAVAPAGWLERALHLWDPSAGFGQLQNQAVGYAFPIAPFFAGARAIGVPPWV